MYRERLRYLLRGDNIASNDIDMWVLGLNELNELDLVNRIPLRRIEYDGIHSFFVENGEP